MIVVRGVLYQALVLYSPVLLEYNCYEAVDGGIFVYGDKVRCWPCTANRERYPALTEPVKIRIDDLGAIVKWSGES